MYSPIIKSNPLFKSSRLRSLYANFDQLKDSNPDGYEANLLAWSTVLSQIFLSQSSPVISTGHLIDDLSITADLSSSHTNIVLRPLSIDSVINHMVNSSDKLMPLDDFLAASASIYDDSLFNSISIKGSILWVLSKSGLYDSQFNCTANSSKNGNYLVNLKLVYIPKLEKIREKVLKMVRTKTIEPVTTQSRLIDCLTNALELSAEDCSVLITFLHRDWQDVEVQKNSITTANGDNIEIEDDVIKFKKNSQDTITVNDVAVAQLTSAIDSNTAKITNLSSKVTSYNDKIASLIQTKASRDHIKLLLKTKKSLESSLIQATANLTNLETILSNIQLQKGNIEVFSLLKNSNSLLKSLNSELDIEKVDSLLEEVQEEKEKATEFGDALAEFNSANNTIIDEDEIESEMEKLEKSEKEKSEKAKKSEKTDLKQTVSDQSLIDRLQRLKVNRSPVRTRSPVRKERREEEEEEEERRSEPAMLA